MPSHRERNKRMTAIHEAINEQKARRLEAEADDRILKTQKFLGEHPNKRCRHCQRQAVTVGHADDCALRKINLESLQKVQSDVRIKMSKDINKQRIFKSDKPRWSGAPPFQKTLVKKRRSKNRGPVAELEKCRVCCEQTLKIASKDGMVCRECGHSRPCVYTPNGVNCKLCFPSSS